MDIEVHLICSGTGRHGHWGPILSRGTAIWGHWGPKNTDEEDSKNSFEVQKHTAESPKRLWRIFWNIPGSFQLDSIPFSYYFNGKSKNIDENHGSYIKSFTSVPSGGPIGRLRWTVTNMFCILALPVSSLSANLTGEVRPTASNSVTQVCPPLQHVCFHTNP